VYSSLPPGCGSTNTSSFSCLPTAAGTYSVSVTVRDALGRTTTATALLGVNPVAQHTSSPPASPIAGVDWWIVALFAVVAAVIAGVLVWRFGRPPEPSEP
jgi:hypothetical protein